MSGDWQTIMLLKREVTGVAWVCFDQNQQLDYKEDYVVPLFLCQCSNESLEEY